MDWTPDEIRRRRDTHGYSQEDLGRVLGEHLGLPKPISRRAISNWETGDAVPQGRNLRALNAVLGEQPSSDDPALSQATFMELLAELARRYARDTARPDEEPPLTSGHYAFRTADAPTARRASARVNGTGQQGEFR